MTPANLTQREAHHASAGKQTLCAPTKASLVVVDNSEICCTCRELNSDYSIVHPIAHWTLNLNRSS